MTNVEKKIEFWQELWVSLIDNFLKKSYGLVLYNPHILIDDIISEIEEDGLKNQDNRNYFRTKINEYLKNDLIIQKKLKSQFKILVTIFDSKRNNYILKICKDIKESFSNGLYFDSSLENITEILLSDEELSVDLGNSLNHFTQGIIIELIKKSYVLDDIKKFNRNIFDKYRFLKNDENTLVTEFPHEIDHNKFTTNGKLNKKSYYNEIIKLIDSLSITDRLQKLSSSYYYRKKETVKYIFVVEGLVGDIDFSIGDCNFYSIEKKRLITKDYEGLSTEDLQKDRKNKKFVQVAVEINYLLPLSSLFEAQTKLENSLDLISCYHKTNTELYVNTSNYIIINDKGHFIFSSMGADKREPFMRIHDSLDLNHISNSVEELNKHSFLWSNNYSKNKSVLKIKNALHWYRKAEHATKQEDKMLHYWIAMENLFNLDTDIMFDVLNNKGKKKFHLIQETIYSTQIFHFIYNLGWELYYYYSSIVMNPFQHSNKFPKKIILDAQLKPKIGEKIHLKNFIINLDEIKKIEDNLFLKEKINVLQRFYSNSKTSKEFIEKEIINTKNDVLMIYRMRNLIVHNAYFDNTLLPYLVWKIRRFSGNLIRKILFDFSVEKNLSDIILGIHFKREKFLHDIKNGNVDLLNL